MKEETITRILVLEIRERNSDSIKWTIDTETIEKLTLYLKAKKYDTIIYLFGLPFMNEILILFEEAENYEECEIIKNQTDKVKQLLNEK